MAESSDLIAINGGNQIAGLHTGQFGCTVFNNSADNRIGYALAEQRIERRKNNNGENEIGDRACGNDNGALPKRLEKQRVAARIVRQFFQFFSIGRAGFVFVTEKLHIAAERQPADFPLRAVLVMPTGNGAPETNREYLNAHATATGSIKMAEFVKEHDNGQNKQKRHNIGQTKSAV